MYVILVESAWIPTTYSLYNVHSGIAIMAGSTVSILLAITWGGIQFPWSSAHVLVPLIVGAVGLMVFFTIEFLWLKGPTVRLNHTVTRIILMRYAGPPLFLHQSHYFQWASANTLVASFSC